jgi:hypothetical protein
MAHFAEIDSNNIVVRVIVCEDNEEGQKFLSSIGGRWIQTSYNTIGGSHVLGGIPLRKNYAGAGCLYDEQLDAFIPPSPFESWELDESTCLWKAPIDMPNDGNGYTWNEENLEWELVPVLTEAPIEP